jgi:hypothetical protein
MKKTVSFLWVAASVILSVVGIAAFILLFVLDFNVYWLILSPIILALYQVPAVFVFWLWKKKARKELGDPTIVVGEGILKEQEKKSAPDGI